MLNETTFVVQCAESFNPLIATENIAISNSHSVSIILKG